MSAPSISDYQRLNDTREVVIKRTDLPLHCPMDTELAWCSHPRVFLDLDASAGNNARCPYCGTLYRLID